MFNYMLLKHIKISLLVLTMKMVNQDPLPLSLVEREADGQSTGHESVKI